MVRNKNVPESEEVGTDRQFQSANCAHFISLYHCATAHSLKLMSQEVHLNTELAFEDSCFRKLYFIQHLHTKWPETMLLLQYPLHYVAVMSNYIRIKQR